MPIMQQNMHFIFTLKIEKKNSKRGIAFPNIFLPVERKHPLSTVHIPPLKCPHIQNPNPGYVTGEQCLQWVAWIAITCRGYYYHHHHQQQQQHVVASCTRWKCAVCTCVRLTSRRLLSISVSPVVITLINVRLFASRVEQSVDEWSAFLFVCYQQAIGLRATFVLVVCPMSIKSPEYPCIQHFFSYLPSTFPFPFPSPSPCCPSSFTALALFTFTYRVFQKNGHPVSFLG